MKIMVVQRYIRTVRLLPAALLLLAVAACNDVPLDTLTFRSDTLSQPVFVGTIPNDTVAITATSTLPDITWRSISLLFEHVDPLNPGRTRRSTIGLLADEGSTVELNTITGGPMAGEYLTVELTCTLPRRVRDSSVATGSDMRTYLQQFAIVIPSFRLPATTPWDIELKSPPYEGERPGASITLARPLNGQDVFKTGRADESHGRFVVYRVDRLNRVMLAHVELAFKLSPSGPSPRRDLDLAMEMTLSY